MYNHTTTTPEIRLHPGLASNGNEIGIAATAHPRWQHTPAGVQEYLQSMGWTPYTASDSDWMYARADIGAGHYMTWEQAVAYCLVKPFLTEKNT